MTLFKLTLDSGKRKSIDQVKQEAVKDFINNGWTQVGESENDSPKNDMHFVNTKEGLELTLTESDIEVLMLVGSTFVPAKNI